MKLSQWLSEHELSHIHFYRKGLIKWLYDEAGNLYIDRSEIRKLTPKEQLVLSVEISAAGNAGLVNFHCLNMALGGGPKVLRLNAHDFEIFENIEVNVRLDEYMQPFETVVIEFPEDYAEKKRCIDPLQKIPMELNGGERSETHKPAFTVLHHDKKLCAILCSIIMTSGDAWTIMIDDRGRGDTKTIAEIIEYKTSIGCYDKSLLIDEREEPIYMDVLRACLNACLYVADCGHKRLGPDNPKHYQRLQHYVDVARKSKDAEKINTAERNLRNVPIIYTLEQSIKIEEETAGSREQTNGEPSYHVKPHWRKGHYRNQHHGPNNQFVKRVRIWPVFVNKRFFGGEEKDTSSVYHR